MRRVVRTAGILMIVVSFLAGYAPPGVVAEDEASLYDASAPVTVIPESSPSVAVATPPAATSDPGSPTAAPVAARAPLTAPAASPASAATPKPSPKNLCSDLEVTAPNPPAGFVVTLRNGEPATFQARDADGNASELQGGIVLRYEPQGFTKTKVCIVLGADGLQVAYEFERANERAIRKRGGVPFADAEDRFELRLVDANDASKSLLVGVNALGKCVVTRTSLVDQHSTACTVAALPSPSPAPPRAPHGTVVPSPTPAPELKPTVCYDNTEDSLCGTVTIQLGALEDVLNPRPTPHGAPGVIELWLHAGTAAAPPARCADASATNGVWNCRPYDVEFLDKAANLPPRISGEVANSGAGASGGGGDSGSSSARLVRAATTTAGANAKQDNGKGFSGLLTVVRPVNFNSRISFETQNTNFITSIDKQTQRYLTNFSAEQVQTGPAGDKLAATATNADDFATYDAPALFRVIDKPFRGFSSSSVPKSQNKAFDWSDVLDLQPFNPAKINEVTYGAKYMWFPTRSAFGAGYYRDRTEGATGTMIHGEGTIGDLTVGASEVVASTQTVSKNLYVTKGPDGTGNSRLHSANTVFGAAQAFGGGVWQSFVRFASVDTGNDVLAAVSSSSRDGGRIVEEDGQALRYATLFGYRGIDPGYTPLGTAYNPLTGTHMAFGRIARAMIFPGKDSDQTFETTVSAARAIAGPGQPARYSSVGLTQSLPLGAWFKTLEQFSVNLVLARSTIARTVIARQSGKYIVDDQTPVNNDTATASLGYTSKFVQLSLGQSATHSPSCTQPKNKPVMCDSTFAHGLTAAATARLGLFVLDGNIAPGSTQSNNPGGTSLASNQLVRAALLAYHVCGLPTGFLKGIGLEPTLVLKNNISENQSAFIPGTLIEESVDIGKTSGQFAVRFSLKRVYDAPGANSGLATNTFGVGLVSGSQTRWTAYKKIDPCLNPIKKTDKPETAS
jgi:hypothetical protein